MIPSLNHYYVARLTLETATPLSITAGGTDGVFDTVLVRDVNGLPTLPGSAVAGVLRHLFWELFTEEDMHQVFGFQQQDTGAFSKLQVSWGYIQDSHGQPIEGLRYGNIQDPLLQAALAEREFPVHRDQVRISHRGVIDQRGKFDRTVLPAGYRFSVELVLWSAINSDPYWQQVLALLKHPLFRLGGNTHAGLGALKLIKAHTGHFDLTDTKQRDAFTRLARSIGSTQGLTALVPKTIDVAKEERFVTAILHLTPRDFWRIGQGEHPNQIDLNGKFADILPKLEKRVVWENNIGKFTAANLLVPASSVKGALAHRVAFHANCRAGRWATVDKLTNYAKEDDPEIRELFGFAGHDNSMAVGRVGRVLLNDAFVAFTPNDIQIMMHNAVDRFTGGVREHMLFSEELVWHKPIEMQIIIDTQGIGATARDALQLALQDLCQGRLSLGSGMAKGHGLFTGTVTWSDGGQFIPNIVAPNTKRAAS
ncbi:hypothetical protein TI04_00725 [Achromatium sp. WMS2]|nr:hypothetical protein TI04_00725 [Achromatium sp. WMS2]